MTANHQPPEDNSASSADLPENAHSSSPTNSPNPAADELISAYLDGEATEQERALVENNPDLLNRLAQFQELSQLVSEPVPEKRRGEIISTALQEYSQLYEDSGISEAGNTEKTEATATATEVLGAGLSESSETSSTQRPPIPERKLPSFFEDEDALGTPGARGFGRSTIFSRSRTKDAGTARPSKSGGRKPSQAAFIGLAALLLVGFLAYSLVLLFNENGDGDDTEAAADVLEAQVADLEPDTDALEEQTSAFLTDSTTSTAIVPEMTTPQPAPTLPAATLPAAAETTQPAPPGDARAETPQDKLPDLDLAPIPSAPEEEASQGTDGSPTFGLPEPPPIQLPATPSPDEPIVAPSPEGMLDAFDRSACPDTATDGPATTTTMTTTTLDDTPSTTIPADEGEKRLEDEEPSASEEAPKSETSDQDESCP